MTPLNSQHSGTMAHLDTVYISNTLYHRGRATRRWGWGGDQACRVNREVSYAHSAVSSVAATCPPPIYLSRFADVSAPGMSRGAGVFLTLY